MKSHLTRFDPLPIAVIESRWDNDSSSLDTMSVRLFFELLGSYYRGNPGAFYYEMFSCRQGFQEILPRIGEDGRFRYAYIASHGYFDGLYGHGDQRAISRAVLRNCLKTSRNLKGVHLATCYFGTAELAQFLFQQGLSIQWVSGYRNSPDWVDSSPIDMMFLHLILQYDGDKSVKDEDKINKIARRMCELMAGACEEEGFSIYVRAKSGAVVDLISDPVVQRS